MQRQRLPARLRLTSCDACQLTRLQECGHREQHARRAEAALQRRVTRERVLQPFELGRSASPSMVSTSRPLGVSRRGSSRRNRLFVEQHRAGAPDLDVAGAFRTGQPQPVAQVLQQQLLRPDRSRHDLARSHWSSSLMPAASPRRRRRAALAHARRPSTPRRIASRYLSASMPSASHRDGPEQSPSVRRDRLELGGALEGRGAERRPGDVLAGHEARRGWQSRHGPVRTQRRRHRPPLVGVEDQLGRAPSTRPRRRRRARRRA